MSWYSVGLLVIVANGKPEQRTEKLTVILACTAHHNDSAGKTDFSMLQIHVILLDAGGIIRPAISDREKEVLFLCISHC